jgi:hypothetical protein
VKHVALTLAVAGLFGLGAAGCSEGVSGEPTDIAPLAPRATSTPLAVEPTERGGGGSFYKPSGWNGVSDVDCDDFDTHSHAQDFFIGTRGSMTNDPYGLDRNHDGISCETLP